MNLKHLLTLTALVLPLTGTITHAGDFSYRSFSGDSNSFIGTGFNYTALGDFNGDGTRVVNGVTFANAGLTGPNYVLSTPPQTYGGFVNNATGGSNGLLSDFVYTNATGDADLTLSGLTIGKTYVTSWYNSGFGNPGGRQIDITPSDTGVAYRFDENYTGDKNGNILRYTFTATATSITYHFDAVSNGDSFHHYAFSNAEANTSLLATPVITRVTGGGPGYSPFTVRNNDLLQTRLSGVNASSNFTGEGAGGLSILNNGAFTINGGNGGDNSQLATIGNDAFVEYLLDVTASPLGYDISSIETYGGWNDAGRDRQLFRLLYSVVGSSAYTEIGGLDADGISTGEPSAIRAIFATSLSGVDAIRVEFLSGQESGYAGYGEIDVVGTATVPEPATAFMFALGGVALVARRRRNGA